MWGVETALAGCSEQEGSNISTTTKTKKPPAEAPAEMDRHSSGKRRVGELLTATPTDADDSSRVSFSIFHLLLMVAYLLLFVLFLLILEQNWKFRGITKSCNINNNSPNLRCFTILFHSLLHYYRAHGITTITTVSSFFPTNAV